MSLFTPRALSLAYEIRELLLACPAEDLVGLLNDVRTIIAEASPFRDEPVDLVLWERGERVVANDYNPNTVAPPEMRLLERSIVQDGITQPIVTWRESDDRNTVVDGFHRRTVGMASKVVRSRCRGYLPIVHVRGERGDIKARMASTVRHNRARGVHGVVRMQHLVGAMEQQGLTAEDVGRELGMDADEVLRFQQTGGLPGLFKGRSYSRAWIGVTTPKGEGDAERRTTGGGRTETTRAGRCTDPETGEGAGAQAADIAATAPVAGEEDR